MPSDDSSAEQQLQWRGLCGAAPFLGVVTDITINTLPRPMHVSQASIEPEQLPQWVQRAEQGWTTAFSGPGGSQTRSARLPSKQHPPLKTTPTSLRGCIASALALPHNQPQRLHAEVVGLLGPACGTSPRPDQPSEGVDGSTSDPGCQLACQQLGAPAQVSPELTSFVHRDAIWKPWITATWPAGNARTRETSLQWLQEVWAVLEPVFPGIHLAQLHDHLPFHQELDLAFGPWLPGLRQLKARRDPDGTLPGL